MEGVQLDRDDTCRQALECFGHRAQMTKCCEELGELTVALCKYENCPDSQTYDNVVEEIADVRIMLIQMVMLFDCDQGVEDVTRQKLERLQRLIECDA